MSITRSHEPAGPKGAQPNRIIQPVLFAPLELVVVQTARVVIRVNEAFTGWKLTAIQGCVTGVQSSSGPVQVTLRNVTQAVDMLTSPVQVDAASWDSTLSASPPVISSSFDIVAAADQLALNVVAAGTGVKGLNLDLTFAPQ